MDYEELEFVIPAYTPETMPLDRLLQYLQQIGEVVGFANDMHLVRIEPSSTKPVFHLPQLIATQARANAAAVRVGSGTRAQRSAYNRIRQMVRRDGGKPASLKDRSGIILDFPPTPETTGTISGVRQATTFDGVLTKVGGVDEHYIPIQMQDLDGEVYSGFTAPKAVAKAMAAKIFEPLRINGIGNWERSPVAGWKLTKMLVQSFDPLTDETLVEAFQKLRGTLVSWPDDADEKLKTERESAL